MSDTTRKTLWNLVRTGDGAAPAVLRLALGLMILPHGAQKLFGWFGGAGLERTVDYFAVAFGLPPAVAVAVAAIEFFGGVALLAGLFSRLAALGIAAVMVGAVATAHLQNGFFMNWGGGNRGEGWEFHLLAVAIALAVVLLGSGVASLDRTLLRRLRHDPVRTA